jgi:elongation factor 1-beta
MSPFHVLNAGKWCTGVRNAESLLIHTNVKAADLRDPEVMKMGMVVMKLRVMPEDVNVDLNSVLEKIKELNIGDVEIRDSAVQPIAFGLKALIVMAVMPDAEGIGDKLIEEIQKLDGVESVEIEGMELV